MKIVQGLAPSIYSKPLGIVVEEQVISNFRFLQHHAQLHFEARFTPIGDLLLPKQMVLIGPEAKQMEIRGLEILYFGTVRIHKRFCVREVTQCGALYHVHQGT